MGTAGRAGFPWVLAVLIAVVVGAGTMPTADAPRGLGAAPHLAPPAGEVGPEDPDPWWRGDWHTRGPATEGSPSVVERDHPAGGAAWDGRAAAAKRVSPDIASSAPEATADPRGEVDPGPVEGEEVSVRTAEGFDVAAGGAAAGTGETVRYTVEVEPAVAADLLAVTAAVEEALNDPRSWVVDHRLERVDDPDRAEVRVVLATPDTVDRLCAAAGLDTEGRYSCWNGTFAALNAMRWHSGADGFDDLTTYRRYLINHEFGHGLGHGHVDCPAPGAPAPVMMQQTMSTGACEPNGWPYPDAEES